MDKHISVVAGLHLALSILGLLLLAGLMVGIEFVTHFIPEPFAREIVYMVFGIIALVTGFKHILGIIGSIGLFKRKNWGRILILIVAALDLPLFPTGTALSVYSFWILIQQETAELLS